MRVELNKDVERRLRKHLRWAGKREIGGILMGEQLAPNHFMVIDFSIDDLTGSSAHFVRTPDYHLKALNDFFSRTGADYSRFNYLGEWHSHPSFPVIPSTVDSDSMQQLVKSERTIDFAILMIVKLKMWFSLEYSLTLYSQKKIQKQLI